MSEDELLVQYQKTFRIQLAREILLAALRGRTTLLAHFYEQDIKGAFIIADKFIEYSEEKGHE